MDRNGQPGDDGFEFSEFVVPALFGEIAVQDDEANPGLGRDRLDDGPQSINRSLRADMGIGDDGEADRLGPEEPAEKERSQERGGE
jgi:hypothetical protein